MDRHDEYLKPAPMEPVNQNRSGGALRLVAGMGTIDDYIPLAEAGADEVFCGYIPGSWTETFGDLTPMNRREVLYTNVQIGSLSELRILKDMINDHQVPVTLALNRTAYEPEMLSYLKEYINQCNAMGFRHFIVADPALLSEVLSDAPDTETVSRTAASLFHLSGEYGELNHLVLQELTERYGDTLTRIIFPRQTTLDEMETLIRFMEERGLHLEYEAFLFNEKCHYTGAYCNSMHSDYFCHMCRVPYRLAFQKSGEQYKPVKAVPPDSNEDMHRIPYSPALKESGGQYESPESVPPTFDRAESATDAEISAGESIFQGSGATGCGLCALYRLRAIGVTHLKLVSRGNYTDATLEDVQLIRKALTILEQSEEEADYIHQMKQTLFPEGCSENCYYM